MPSRRRGRGRVSAEYVDDEAGPVVRLYALTKGRTRPSTPAFDLLAVVVATATELPALPDLGIHHRRLLVYVNTPKPVAEIASMAGLPIGVVRVLLGDLLDHGLILVRAPSPAAEPESDHLLHELISGLRAL
ncbi:DUF742 domain-containing protein [Microtetraspora sp. NBRC 13810]|uniref:DUF742 domain-containing protein n=1 Tax=Microtetraspora sp. NBRC 13810 TaxID=3030990 RepID=UPI0025563D3D|nr:DUF742 domain-containing protein [Microtetraspora sp. NBRC 13810]